MKTQFITLYGKQYKVRCPAGQETVLKQTEDLLNQQLLETKQKSGLTNREDIIMMTALNLCRDAVEQKLQVQEQQSQLVESQASAMLNTAPKANSSNAVIKPRAPGSAIAEAASKASRIMKDKAP